MSEKIYPEIDKVVVFTLDDFLYALPVRNVVRVVHALEIRKLPKSPEVVSGIINVRGQIIPVVDLRKRFCLVKREIIPDDKFLIARTEKRHIALWVDDVSGIKDLDPVNYSDSKGSLPYAEFIKGVAKIENDIILIYDLEQCLNLNEEMELEQALSNRN